ncbi:hypothetical protein CBW56_16375 [Denitratisoma oestradiolicum]|nr:hypothetical protein CBW56_16375 [Denitratisoma oestradiolicum]
MIPLSAAGEEEGMCLGFGTDISELIETEQRLEEQKVIFRGITDTLSTSITLRRGRRLLYTNHALETLTGYSRKEMDSNPIGFFIHPDVRDKINQEIRDWQDGGKGLLSREIPIITKNGEHRWVALNMAIVEHAGEPTTVATAYDITRRKQAEESLRRAHDNLEIQVRQRTEQLALAKADLEADVHRREVSETKLMRQYTELSKLNQQLQSAHEQLVQSEKLASIGQLAAGVAHEINNPIGYVQSNLGSLDSYLQDLFELLAAYEAAAAALPADHPALLAATALRREKDLDFLRQDVPNLMGESQEGIGRVRKIVADLKDFSRVDSDQTWQWTDLHRGLDSTLNIVNNEIKYKADVVKEYGDLPEVECLSSQLNQVFMNLLVNAAHSIKANRGLITLRTGREGSDVWVEVADNGCGIPPENLGRIFDPFFTTKPVGKGTGLGLSLSYGIVQKHHGRIEVKSQIEQGTTFRVTLPIKQSETERQSP